jgi:hypothetical protein
MMTLSCSATRQKDGKLVEKLGRTKNGRILRVVNKNNKKLPYIQSVSPI